MPYALSNLRDGETPAWRQVWTGADGFRYEAPQAKERSKA